MENSAKALLIAAGVLIALMVLSILVVAYNQITSYYSGKNDQVVEEQVAAFNKEYEVYNRSNLTGFEMVSLINKVIDYNANNAVDTTAGFNNSTKDYTKMTVTFKYKSDHLFTKGTYSSDYDKSTDSKYQKADLTTIMSEMQALESKYGATNMSSIASNFANDESGYNDPETVKSKLKLTITPNLTKYPTYEEVQKYQEYIDFKRAKFNCINVEYNKETGRIIKMEFENK
jgi:hypothetical protein